MSGLPDKHPIFNRSVLWSVFLFSTALFVPWVLAETLPNPLPSKTKASSPTSSPQSQPLADPSPDLLIAERAQREWHQRLVSQSLSGSRSTGTASSATASKSSASQTNTPPSKSSASKTNSPQSSKSTTKAQASALSQTSKQQKSQSPSSSKSEANASYQPRNIQTLELRVAISNGQNALAVGSSTPAQILDAQGKVIGTLPANEASYVLPNGPNIRLDKWETPAGVWIKPTNGGLLFVGDRWYRGNLLIVSQGNSVLAVNYVELESYIASVVGSEVSPSWPIDALKAQAIAARSYALVHYLRPAHNLFDLGNTERWQVYKGIDSEWNTTRQAVEETRGLFLSYKGGVVESMYAASDDIVKNVFGGRGMSQTGALTLAQQGYNYQQILHKYYPGTGLAWLDAGSHDTE